VRQNYFGGSCTAKSPLGDLGVKTNNAKKNQSPTNKKYSGSE
jgi:hypothetical protein